MQNGINILVGGAAGQGLATVGQLLAKSLVRAGHDIVVTQDYMSRIRGGHNTFAIRVGEGVKATVEDIHILVAMNQETVTLHKDHLASGGVILLDEKLDPEGCTALAAPFKELAPKPIFESMASLGVLCALLGIDPAIPEKLARDTFGKKGDEVVNQNIEVLEKAAEWHAGQKVDFPHLPKAPDKGTRLMMHGNEAIVLGALAAGTNFSSFYPMTPATSISLGLSAYAKRMGLVVEQAEDEIAAVNMALGAVHAGARAMVATSGGGLALMIEGISLAGILELPIVFGLSQRPGPATGLPTRTEQADLNMVLYAGHGEFPRAIFAPGDVEQCFHDTYRAFDQAERYQSPAFVLTDQFLADSYRAVKPFDLDALPPLPAPGTEVDDPASYERYAVTESGVSPRLVPGTGEHLVVADSDEHTPDGHITEDLEVRVTMNDKRLRKGCGLWEDVLPPDLIGEAEPDLLLVCWGSTRGAAEEAAAILTEDGTQTSVLHFHQVYPLNNDHFLPILKGAGAVVCVEGNATGQFADLLLKESGFKISRLVLRYDGLPFTAKYILDRLKD